MTLFQERLLNTLQSTYGRTRAPVRTLNLAVQLDAEDRVIRAHLVKLEKMQKVARRGQRGGWMPARVLPQPVALAA